MPKAPLPADKGGRKGKFEMADGGTLFLDEIGDMPLSLQSKLLRGLQTQEVGKAGSGKIHPVNGMRVAYNLGRTRRLKTNFSGRTCSTA